MKEGSDQRHADAVIVDFMSGSLDAEARRAAAERLIADAEARTILAMAAMAASTNAPAEHITVRPAIARPASSAPGGSRRIAS